LQGENFTVNRAQSCSTQNSLTQTFFLQNQGLTGTDNQYNKISEESDTAEDHVNSDDTTNKFAPLNLESTHKWCYKQFLLFKEKSISIKLSVFFWLFSTNLHYNKSLKNLIISFIS
jgi:hypothetical protein